MFGAQFPSFQSKIKENNPMVLSESLQAETEQEFYHLSEESSKALVKGSRLLFSKLNKFIYNYIIIVMINYYCTGKWLK